MIKQDFFNILDYGNSKIRFSVFDNNLNEKYSNSKILVLENDYSNHFDAIEGIIKNSEKKISNHIKDIIITLDTPELLTIDVSLNKNLDGKNKFIKIYDSLFLELKQLINSSYDKFYIVHTLVDSCFIDNNFHEEIPKHKSEINNIKINFKLLCFPKKIIDDIKSKFSKININVTKFYCTSYIKSLSYFEKLNIDKASFLEIGLKRTSLISFEKNKLKFIQTIPIGSFNITKDISKIFNLTLYDAEKIKKSFHKSETEFSYNDIQNKRNISAQEIINKNISVDLLKKVILYRVQEIIDLTFKKSNSQSYNSNLADTQLFLIGDGSILFKDNSFYLNNKFQFSDINYYNETDTGICNTCLVYYLNNYNIPKKDDKKQGLFEKFFNFFSK